jgi:hypothetical protein
MADKRTVAVCEVVSDLLRFSQNEFNFKIAKPVNGKDGQLTFNLVWQSRNLAPCTTISWTLVHGSIGLATLSAGVSVTLGGLWTPCAIGQSLDISNVGLFVQSTKVGKANFMNIGNSSYPYGGVNGIHIAIGVQNDSSSFDPVRFYTQIFSPSYMHCPY